MRNEARQCFKDKGLTYNDISLEDLNFLEALLNLEFAKRTVELYLNPEKPKYWVRVNPAKYYKGEYTEDGKLICAFLTGKGTYFTAREVISFRRDGYIEFCCDADMKNTEPVMVAFLNWCDWLAERKEDANGKAETL